MKSALDIQTFASVLFVGTFAAAECAARQLQEHPASPLVWRLNLGVFRAFEHARVGLHPAHLLFSPASLPTALTLLVVILASRMLRCRFGVALFANLSFLGSLSLCYAVTSEKLAHRAALSPAAILGDTQLPLVATLMGASFIAFVVSHWSFLRAIFAAAAPATAARDFQRRPDRKSMAAARARTLFRAVRGGSVARLSEEGGCC